MFQKRAGLKHRGLRDEFFREFKRLQLSLLKQAVYLSEITHDEIPFIILAYTSEVAESNAYACYSVKEDRIVTISCTLQPENVHCIVGLPRLFNKVWQTYKPARSFITKKVKWHIKLKETEPLPALKKCPVRWEFFQFTCLDNHTFRFHHYLN